MIFSFCVLLAAVPSIHSNAHAAASPECNQKLMKLLTMAKGGSSIDASTLSYSKRMADRLLRKDPSLNVERVISSGMEQQDVIHVLGVPRTLKKIDHGGKTVYRHYTNQALDAILESKSLKAGPRPFIDPFPHERKEYQELTGVMFTSPETHVNELWMDADEKTDWIEFTLDSEIPVLLCKEGNYLVPLQKKYPDWIRKEYERYIETGSDLYKLGPDFERLKATGGMFQQQAIPIRVKRYQKNGIVHE